MKSVDEDESQSRRSVTVLVNRGRILIVSSIINYRCRSSNTTPAINNNKQTMLLSIRFRKDFKVLKYGPFFKDNMDHNGKSTHDSGWRS